MCVLKKYSDDVYFEQTKFTLKDTSYSYLKYVLLFLFLAPYIA